jgi:general secretion pathway protein D
MSFTSVARAVALLSVLFLPSCAEKGNSSVTEQKTVTTTLATSYPGDTRPIELRRFAANGSGPIGGAPGKASSEIYAGTGSLYTPVSRSGSGVKAEADGEIALDFFNADVREVAKSVLGDLLGLNYLVDNSVQGTITVQTNQKLRKDDVLPAFETVLRANGLALVQQGGFYTVVPFGSAGKAASVGGNDAGYGTEIVTLHSVSPEQMRRVLEPITPQGTIVQVDQARNMMVIGGTEGERAAIRENIATFDVDWLRGMSFALFKPRVATAKQMASDLQHVMGDENSPMAGQVRLVPIDRMNAVLAIASQAKQLEELRGWVTRLDQGNDTTERRIYVYYVQNGRASDLSRVLGKALGIHSSDTETTQGASSGAGQSGGGGRSSSSSGFSGQSQGFSGGGGGFGSSSGFGGGQSSMGNNLPQPQSTNAIGPGSDSGVGPAGPNGSGNDQNNGVSITADEVNNALLVVATASEYEIIESALKRLDILPLQVMIEAAIAEVTLTKDMNFGVQWAFNNGHNNLALSASNSASILPSFPGFSYIYTGGSKITAVLSALQDLTKVDVLSSPKLMVLNNQTATLQVGDQVPIATQSSVSTVSSDAPIVSSIEYKDTGVILTVTPRVNEGGLVLMDISQEVSDVAATTSSTLNSPTINERKIGSTVAIQDGQTIALGGLIKDDRTSGKTGVPYLQDIPVLGQLFRQDNNNTTRTELLVLITPRVIRDGRDAAAVTADLRAKLMDLKEEFVPPLRLPSR